MASNLLRSLADKVRCLSLQFVAEWRKDESFVAVGTLVGCDVFSHALWRALIWEQGFVCVHSEDLISDKSTVLIY